MAISKLIFNGVIQMDLTSDTVTASVLNSGYTAHDAAGEAITGTGGGGGGDSWSWLGKNPTLIQNYPVQTIYFNNSALASWTWSTTQATILATQNYTQFTGDIYHDYVGVYHLQVHYDYGNWSPVSAMSDFSFVAVSAARRTASSVANAQSGTLDTLQSVTGLADYRSYYYNSSGSMVFSTAAYGVYANASTTPSFVGASTNAPQLTFKTPNLYAKGSATYFSETAYENLNKSTSYYKTSCQVWSVDEGSFWSAQMYSDILDALNNGL